MGRLSAALLALALAPPASAALIATSGGVSLLAAPLGSTLEGTSERSLRIQLFEERLRVRLATVLAVDVAPAGAGSGSIPARVPLDRLFARFDEVDLSPGGSGSLLLDSDALAAIAAWTAIPHAGRREGSPGTRRGSEGP